MESNILQLQVTGEEEVRPGSSCNFRSNGSESSTGRGHFRLRNGCSATQGTSDVLIQELPRNGDSCLRARARAHVRMDVRTRLSPFSCTCVLAFQCKPWSLSRFFLTEFETGKPRFPVVGLEPT